MTANTAPSLSQPPHGLAVSRFVDSVRRSPLRVKSRLEPLPLSHVFCWSECLSRSLFVAFVLGFRYTVDRQDDENNPEDEDEVGDDI